MLSLGSLAFAAPWALAALAALPLLWWLLRITPPAPQRIGFPAIRLLFGLTPRERTPARTPPWLILLRMLVATLVILGLSQPLINPPSPFHANGPVVLVVDDGWASAAGWERRIDTLESLLARAEREDRAVMLLATAAPADGGPIIMSGLMSPATARNRVQTLVPRPWPPARGDALAALEAADIPASVNLFWLADGIETPGVGPQARPSRPAEVSAHDFARALQRKGPLTILTDPPAARSPALLPPLAEDGGLRLALLRSGGGEATAWVRGLDESGRVLARTPVPFPERAVRVETPLDLPVELRNRLARLEIEGVASAGTTILLDEQWRRRPVGIVTTTGDRAQEQPLLSEVFYLDRALAPFADLSRGDVGDLLARDLAVLILPDSVTLSELSIERILGWVEKGGTLLRVAGPRLAAAPDSLTPVPLRRGDRVLGGAMSWSEPSALAPFAADSPFAGLMVPGDVQVHRQVLAQPSLDLPRQSWARLEDGTPLVTWAGRGQGQMVLLHTTANADWSNLALSGLFVEMLRRLVDLSQGVSPATRAAAPPLSLLDGFGRFVPPGQAVRALPALTQDAPPAIGPAHPPGYYGTPQARRALNLTEGMTDLVPFGALPSGVSSGLLAPPLERDLKPWLLALAILVLLIDLWISLALRGLLPPLPGRRARSGAAAAILALGLISPALAPWQGTGSGAGSALAQSLPGAETRTARPAMPEDRWIMEATFETRLAHVLTGDERIDSIAHQGLSGLSRALRNRTSVEPEEPIAIDINRDEISVFPLLYWPIAPGQSLPDAAARERLARFLSTGGMILFDTRDQGGVGGESGALQRLLQGLRMPPLAPVPPDHILTRAFYLLGSFPGRWEGGDVWVESAPALAHDGVSSVVIGSNDYAAAWATDPFGQPLFAVTPGGERQREMALRFGINLVMYALTGNYKSDQVHVPAILERLGQ